MEMVICRFRSSCHRRLY